MHIKFSFWDMFIGTEYPIYWIISVYLSIWSLGANFFYVRHQLRGSMPKLGVRSCFGHLLMFLFVALFFAHAIVNFYFRLGIKQVAGESLGIHFTPFPAALFFVGASLFGQLSARFARGFDTSPLNARPVHAAFLHFIMPGWGMFLFGFFAVGILVMWIEIFLVFLDPFFLIGQEHKLSILVFFIIILHLFASCIQPMLILRMHKKKSAMQDRKEF